MSAPFKSWRGEFICILLRQHGACTLEQIGDGMYKRQNFPAAKRSLLAKKAVNNLVKNGFVHELDDGRYAIKVEP